MLDRIMQHKPKRFFVLDLTSGYHQLKIHEHCRKYTAFAAFNGIYEWTRVPMRLKGAGSYSQMMMTTDDVNRPKEGEEKDYTDKIMVFQSLERPRGVGVRYCFEFEAKDVGDTQGPTLFVRRNGCGLQCCMMMRIGIRLCERDQEAELTFINLPDAEFEEEKDLVEVEHDKRSSNIIRMQRGAEELMILRYKIVQVHYKY
jgi:hypothetical protein